MKRTIITLGILGLVSATAAPAFAKGGHGGGRGGHGGGHKHSHGHHHHKHHHHHHKHWYFKHCDGYWYKGVCVRSY